MYTIDEKLLPKLQLHVLSGNLVSCRNVWGGTNVISDTNKFYLVLDGEFIYEIANKHFLVKPGQLVFIAENVPHSLRLTKKQLLNKYYVHFYATVEEKNLFELLDISAENYVISFSDSTQAEKLFQNLFYFTDYYNTTAKIMHQHSSLAAIIALYIEHCFIANGVSLPKLREKFNPLTSYMQAHLADHITVEKLAQFQLTSPSQLTREFRQAFGMPPMRYFDGLRIERAKYLLQETDSPMHLISLAVGIEDQAYFSRFFKNHVGTAPTDYRRSFR